MAQDERDVQAAERAVRVRYCVHCGEPIVGDDMGGWLHDEGGIGGYRSCRLTAFPEPELGQ